MASWREVLQAALEKFKTKNDGAYRSRIVPSGTGQGAACGEDLCFSCFTKPPVMASPVPGEPVAESRKRRWVDRLDKTRDMLSTAASCARSASTSSTQRRMACAQEGAANLMMNIRPPTSSGLRLG